MREEEEKSIKNTADLDIDGERVRVFECWGRCVVKCVFLQKKNFCFPRSCDFSVKRARNWLKQINKQKKRKNTSALGRVHVRTEIAISTGEGRSFLPNSLCCCGCCCYSFERSHTSTQHIMQSTERQTQTHAAPNERQHTNRQQCFC